MAYLKSISSLEERASAQVAVNLCQEIAFKEVALCLEKPTYGAFINEFTPLFVSDPDKLFAWAKMKEANVKEEDFISFCFISDKRMKEQWDAAVDEQCQRLTEKLPPFLRHGVRPWIHRIALEYLSYNRRQEVLFGVSRYFLMDVITRKDWTDAARLDEKSLAKRLLKDVRLTVLQRYRIACVYCLHGNIPQLWKRLTKDEKRSISGNDNPYFSQECNRLVLLWSYQMDGHREEKVTRRRNSLWTYGAQQAMRYGNRAALMSCWKKLKYDIRQRMVIDMALQSLQIWESIRKKFYNWRQQLVSLELPSTQFDKFVKDFNIPSYYSELMCFFLSQMNEEQQLTFFTKAFQSRYCDSVLECFLDWPHQDYFLPTVNRFWEIIPKDKYGQCLLTLARKYSGEGEKENRYYDYRSLLSMLWENTPEEYKQYVFSDRNSDSDDNSVTNVGKLLLPRLLKRSPFREIDETLFKLVFYDQPQESRRAMMRSKVGEHICALLTQKEKWSFVNWLLEECLPKEEIPSFKKQFILSECGQKLCCSKLRDNRDKLVKDIIDWSVSLDAEKSECKYELIRGNNCLSACMTFLSNENFTEVERMINFCLSSDKMKERIKVHLATYTCSSMLYECVWEQMNTILAWSVKDEEKIRDIKKTIFSSIGVDKHFELVFIEKRFEEVKRFYKWFDLSPEEIKKLKKDTVFSTEAIDAIRNDLYLNSDIYVVPFRWCLSDQEMVFDLKKKVEKELFEQVLCNEGKKAKEWFEHYVKKLLRDFQKEAQEKKSRGVTVKNKGKKRSGATVKNKEEKRSAATVKNKGEKRSAATEHKSSSARKRCK